ncbi:hypothetical protein P7K49_002377, partial [Saguinus oedipus]
MAAASARGWGRPPQPTTSSSTLSAQPPHSSPSHRPPTCTPRPRPGPFLSRDREGASYLDSELQRSPHPLPAPELGFP